MKPVVPEKGVAGAEFVEIGLGQEEYAVLPAYISPDGQVMTEWEPTQEEREVLLRGGRLRMWMKISDGKLPPVFLEVAGRTPKHGQG